MELVISEIIAGLSKIPATWWSALLAGVISLLTMIVTNRHSARQLQRQLDHQAEQKDAERRMTLRRDVYLPAAEFMVRFGGLIGSLPTQKLDDLHANEAMNGFMTAMAKIQIVCEPGTAASAAELSAMYNTSILKFIPLASAIQGERTMANFWLKQYEESQQEVSRVLAEITQIKEKNISDDSRLSALDQSFKSFAASSAEYAESQQQHLKKANDLQLKYLRDVTNVMREIGEKNVGMLVAIRHELGFNGDIGEFEKILKLTQSAIEESLNKTAAELEFAENSDSASELNSTR